MGDWTKCISICLNKIVAKNKQIRWHFRSNPSLPRHLSFCHVIFLNFVVAFLVGNVRGDMGKYA